MKLRAALACLLSSFLAACAVADPAERLADAEEIADEGRLAPLILETTTYDLHARIRSAGGADLLVVYIEGDGFPWKRRFEKSDDPTPLDPVALRLAAADPAPAVAWLARPCQFTGGLKARTCTHSTWTGARYSGEVVAATNEALDALKARTGARKLALVGYSGGGTVAALAAARRNDVVWLKTVASPLDTDAFTTHHKVSALSGSLNPADDTAALIHLPQIHYVGAEDDIVPAEVNGEAVTRLGAAGCAVLRLLPDTAHAEGWLDAWPRLSAETPTCR